MTNQRAQLMLKGTVYMNYKLWLLVDETGRIKLRGWSETGGDSTDPDVATRIDYWPDYPLCEDRAQLPERLGELGMALDSGADLNDLDKDWDVYLQHSDVIALKSVLDRQKAGQ